MKELLIEWAAALRSGQYTQTRNWMRIKDCFCAVGVLGDLLVKKNVGFKWTVDEGLYPYRLAFSNPNDTGYKQSGTSVRPFSELYPLIPDHILLSWVMRKNDSELETFETIADYIDTEIAKL